MPKTKTLVAAGAASLLLLAGCAEGDHDDHDAGEDFNDVDADYIAGMIEHHEQAIEMSDLVLNTDDVDPQVTELADDIKTAQGPEIELMNEWLDDWGHSGDDHGDHSEHAGMLSDEDLADLAAADGDDTTTLFLQQMIEHHEGAIVAAEDHLKEGENDAALELSDDIIADQAAEIELMRDLLAEL